MSRKNVRLRLFLSVACSNVEFEEGSLVLDVSSPPGAKTLLPGPSMVPDSYDFHGAGPERSTFDTSCRALAAIVKTVSMSGQLGGILPDAGPEERT